MQADQVCGAGLFAQRPQEGQWGDTTKKTNAYFLRTILAKFGDTAVRDLDKVELQDSLDKLATESSRSTVKHCFTFLRSISPRPGELFAFRRRSVKYLPECGRYVLEVSETMYKSKMRDRAKTTAAKGYIALPQQSAAELIQWRRLTEWPKDNDFIFHNREGGFLDYENFEARVLQPIRQKLGLAKLNFQVLRRTLSTRAVADKLGSIKGVQNLYRHTTPDTALLNYIKDVPESVFQMVDAAYEAMFGKATTGSLPSTEVKTVH